MLNVKSIKKDFPIFQYHPELVYLDSTATSLKPKSVINKLVEYYEQYGANIHRGIYKISERATTECEETREIVAQFINTKKTQEIIFTRNTTESINLLAYALGREIVGRGDEVMTTIMEHHSNFVPWQILTSEVGGVFKVVDIDNHGYLSLNLGVTKKTKILTLTYISNVLGTINPIKEIIKRAKAVNPNVIIVVDAAQAVPHLKINVQDLGCDFLAFSSHKMLGPTGIGVLWGKEALLKEMFPFQYGGDMVSSVAIEKTTFKDVPHKFEAGTPDIAAIIALKEAIFYLQKTGLASIHNHEKKLVQYAMENIQTVFSQKIRILGPQNYQNRAGLLAFTFKDYHPHDIAQILDEENIAIRAGHHCAMPLHKRLSIQSSARASFYLYNDKNDVDKLIEGLRKVERTLK